MFLNVHIFSDLADMELLIHLGDRKSTFIYIFLGELGIVRFQRSLFECSFLIS